MSTTAPAAPLPEAGLLLRLAGPLQSWGEHSHYNQRDTAAFPTRSGVIGLLAAALGRHRDEPVDDLARLSPTVRADRPGVMLRDLHTVGGGLPTKETVTTAEGKKRGGETSTLLTHRYYLADAAFTIALTSPHPHDAPLLKRCARALRAPHWPLFLGRRSCPPEGPVLLGYSDDSLRHLLHLPLAAPKPRPGQKAAITFFSDRPLDRLPVPATMCAPGGDSDETTQPFGEVNDDPVSFAPRRRTYRARPLYRRTLSLPPGQYAGLGTDQLRALDTYLQNRMPVPEGGRR